MTSKRLKVLLIVEQCNPDWFSVPLEGYKYFEGISKFVDVTLVTHERNKKAIQATGKHQNVIYIPESNFIKKYYKFASRITSKGRVNWPLRHALTYPMYAEFNDRVYAQVHSRILAGDFDIVHALTPMMPRYPVRAIRACQQTPFVLGPVNGGVPFPPGFQKTARQEFAHLNFLRAIGRLLIPGYVETYKKSDKILAGSTYTLNLLKSMFAVQGDRIRLFYENGISKEFFVETKRVNDSTKVNLLFVGRLVPYKGADIVIEAASKLEQAVKDKISLTIVGDGSEKTHLETLVQKLGMSEIVHFTGMVPQQETVEYYKKSDIFCFPSIREFGGAVVLEAMACGLPCIVANNGGIGEYVTEETGFKIEPTSREYLTQELANKMKLLIEDAALRQTMSARSIDRAREFEWEWKAKKIVEIYEEMLDQGASPALSQAVV
jgi:glycosyltransferase involved in cell wall biosynthesis